jgi:hypothetical protein
MPEGMRWVGLDVHAYESGCAVFDAASGEVESRKLSGRPHQLIEWLGGWSGPPGPSMRLGRRATGWPVGPTERGLEVAVCAPGHIARRPGDRVKTDKRDALRLARLFAAGDLKLVTVPPPEHERLRDLVRCREDLRGVLMRARHQISKFLLRRELYYPGNGRGRGGRNWTQHHRDWLAGLRFEDRASELCFADYLHAHDVLLARREGLDRALAEIAQDCPWTALIGRLRRLSRAGALGVELGRAAPPGLDHQGRLRPRPPAAGRGGPPLQPPATRLQAAAGPPGGPAGVGDRDGLALPAPALRPLAATASRARQARRDRDRRDRARARHLLPATRGHRVSAAQPITGCWGGAGRGDSRTMKARDAAMGNHLRVAAPEPRQRAVRRTDGLGGAAPRISA